MKQRLRVIDFETTGLPSEEKEQNVIEYAFVDINLERNAVFYAEESLVKPNVEVEITARAIHHIKDSELEGAMSWGEAYNNILDKNDDEELIFVAHNADFEKEFFSPPDAQWVDTYKVALKLYPDAPSHSNQALKYYLNIADQDSFYPPHRALPDALLTAELVLLMLKTNSLEDLIQISDNPKFYTKLAFGKHYGKKYSEVPSGYLKWLINTSGMEEAVILAAQRALANK